MKGKRTWIGVVAAGIGGCLLTVGVVFICLAPMIGIVQRENAPRCHAPTQGFWKANLTGTWIAGDPSDQDTLVIGPDGTYKQVVHIEYADLPPTGGESDWQPWRLEYSPDNIPYLHLSGYAFCGMNAAIPCTRRDGDGYDFCRDKYLPMNGEGILVVLEASPEKPAGGGRQYYYFLFYPLGSQNSYADELREP